jgi:hypothetical protein
MRSASLRFADLLAPCLLGAMACSSFGSSDTTATVDGGSGGNGGTADSGTSEAGAEGDATAPAPAFLSVFVSSATHVGQFPPGDAGGSALTGFSGANAFCKAAADSSTIASIHGLTWVAWLSTSLAAKGDVRDRLPRTPTGEFLYEYRLTDGVTEVFPRGFNLDATNASPLNPIALDENGKVLGNALVWTGTLPNGTTRASTDCGGWNAQDPSKFTGVLGNSGILATWSADGNRAPDPCSSAHNVYCFQVP